MLHGNLIIALTSTDLLPFVTNIIALYQTSDFLIAESSSPKAQKNFSINYAILFASNTMLFLPKERLCIGQSAAILGIAGTLPGNGLALFKRLKGPD